MITNDIIRLYEDTRLRVYLNHSALYKLINCNAQAGLSAQFPISIVKLKCYNEGVTLK